MYRGTTWVDPEYPGILVLTLCVYVDGTVYNYIG